MNFIPLRERSHKRECFNSFPSSTAASDCPPSSISVSSIIFGRIFLVLDTDDLFFILARRRNIVCDGRAID